MKKIFLAFILSVIANNLILAQWIKTSIPLQIENKGFTISNQTTFRTELDNNTNTNCTAMIPIGVSADIAPRIQLHIGIIPSHVDKFNIWRYTLKLKGIDNKDYWVDIHYKYMNGVFTFYMSGFTPHSGYFSEYGSEKKISKPLGLNLIFKDLNIDIVNDQANQANQSTQHYIDSILNIKELTSIEITSNYNIHFVVNDLIVSVPKTYAQNIGSIKIPKKQGEYTASGSGFVLTTNGIIATNYHVIEDVENVDVFVNRNGAVKKYKAKVLISDKTNDLSLLKIDDASFIR